MRALRALYARFASLMCASRPLRTGQRMRAMRACVRADLREPGSACVQCGPVCEPTSVNRAAHACNAGLCASRPVCIGQRMRELAHSSACIAASRHPMRRGDVQLPHGSRSFLSTPRKPRLGLASGHSGTRHCGHPCSSRVWSSPAYKEVHPGSRVDSYSVDPTTPRRWSTVRIFVGLQLCTYHSTLHKNYARSRTR